MRAALIAIALLLARPVPALAQDDRPSTGKLVATGVVTAVPTYWLGVVMHEGMHAVVAKACGADILQFEVLPGRYGPERRFYFGYVRYLGRLSLGQQTLFLLAPKLNDLVWLGGYAALVGLDAAPADHYAQVILAVVATGFWIDFTKDLLQFWHPTDVDIALERNGARSFGGRLPWRLLHIGVSAAAAIALVQGWRSAFARDSMAAAPLMVPLVAVRF